MTKLSDCPFCPTNKSFYGSGSLEWLNEMKKDHDKGHPTKKDYIGEVNEKTDSVPPQDTCDSAGSNNTITKTWLEWRYKTVDELIKFAKTHKQKVWVDDDWAFVHIPKNKLDRFERYVDKLLKEEK